MEVFLLYYFLFIVVLIPITVFACILSTRKQNKYPLTKTVLTWVSILFWTPTFLYLLCKPLWRIYQIYTSGSSLSENQFELTYDIIPSFILSFVALSFGYSPLAIGLCRKKQIKRNRKDWAWWMYTLIIVLLWAWILFLLAMSLWVIMMGPQLCWKD